MQEAINQVIEYGIEILETVGEHADVADLHHYLYNTDYFIIGTAEARDFVESYGVFDAIGKIHIWEKDNIGEVTTDFADPEKVANMLAFVIGGEVLSACPCITENWEKKVTPKLLDQLRQELKVQLKNN